MMDHEPGHAKPGERERIFPWMADTSCCQRCTSHNVSLPTNEPGSHGWVKNYHCLDCHCNHQVNYGDKMGGQFDSIDYEP